MLNKQQISELKIRECEGQWVAGWWDDRFSPSSASGDMGFYADTPEDAVKALLNYVLDNTLSHRPSEPEANEGSVG